MQWAAESYFRLGPCLCTSIVAAKAKKRAMNGSRKYEAQLRRMCTSKKRGLQVPESVHKLWKKGGKARRDLEQVLIECQGDKDPSIVCNTILILKQPDHLMCRRPLSNVWCTPSSSNDRPRLKCAPGSSQTK